MNLKREMIAVHERLDKIEAAIEQLLSMGWSGLLSPPPAKAKTTKKVAAKKKAKTTKKKVANTTSVKTTSDDIAKVEM